MDSLGCRRVNVMMENTFATKNASECTLASADQHRANRVRNNILNGIPQQDR